MSRSKAVSWGRLGPDLAAAAGALDAAEGGNAAAAAADGSLVSDNALRTPAIVYAS